MEMKTAMNKWAEIRGLPAQTKHRELIKREKIIVLDMGNVLLTRRTRVIASFVTGLRSRVRVRGGILVSLGFSC